MAYVRALGLLSDRKVSSRVGYCALFVGSLH